MYGLNIDPNNPRGNPDPAELRDLGVEMVRYTYHDPGGNNQLDPTRAEFFRERVRSYYEVGIESLIILTYDTLPNRPAPDAPDNIWDDYIGRFARRAAQIAELLAPWRPAFQVWNEPDHPVHVGYVPTLREPVFGRMLRRTYDALKAVKPDLLVVAAGLAAGDPGWLTRVAQSVGGQLPTDVIAFHPYGQRPDRDWPNPNWAFGYLGDLLTNYYTAGKRKPIWITEMGVREEDLNRDRNVVGEFLRRYYLALTSRYSDKVQQLFWFCYSDGMVPTFGLRDGANNPKPSYHIFRELALSRPPDEEPVPPEEEPGQIAALDRLHFFAQYLEQNLAFGQRNDSIRQQMETELRGNKTRLTKEQIQQVAGRMLMGSTFSLSAQEIESLYALQQEKDLYGLLRSIVLATHQRTGAWTGRLGLHTRISAESEFNANTNIAALLGALAPVEPGNRMIVMDMVKANDDETKLRDPDVFETDVYGRHRNGLIDNHAWNLQKLVRAIRDRGYQDRVLLILRLDGPDGGANVNVFSTQSRQKYELAIFKVIRYLETVLPDTPFKLVLGNEPDLPQERLWSDPHADARTFTINQFAPAVGSFIKRLARQRPDVSFLCPALSANLKHDTLSYYVAMFGDERPANMLPGMHGYAGDVAVIPGDRQNLVEQQIDALRRLGGFPFVSGTEIGSSNPFADGEYLGDKGRMADVALWLMLSKDHQTPPGQDNNWSFRFDPSISDPAAGHFASIVNRTKAIVLRNVLAQGGAGLQLLRDHIVDRPAYAVDYVNHNTPGLMVAGQVNAVQITLRNTTYRTWAAAGPHPVRLGYRWYTGEGQEAPAHLWPDNRTELPFDLPPDQTVTLHPNLGAPRVAGSYEVRWDMVEEMRTWFSWQGAPTLDVPVTVRPEGEAPPPGDLSVSASHNNQWLGEENLAQAIDGNAYTRWSSREPQKPGMWFQINLGEVQTVSSLRLVNDPSPKDYPRGYLVRVSEDGQSWTPVAENQLNDGPVDVTFNPQQARFIRIEQTGSDPLFWWSIHEVEVSDEALLSASASHNNVQVGGDNVRQAVDGRPDTRWSSMALQQPGMWFEIDLGQEKPVAGLRLDNAGSSGDYPRGYVVRLSTDRTEWVEVARDEQNNGPLDASFAARPARYIRVEQTGRADQNWWSIHEVGIEYGEISEPGEPEEPDEPDEPGDGEVPGDGEQPAWQLSASHNNVQSGYDNLDQALDGRPDTRWSTVANQQPGMWVEIDLTEIQVVTGLALDNAGSPDDYPRGYVVRVSTDHNQWVEVARNDQNNGPLDVTFGPHCARYIRIEQTATSDRWWWSIHEISVQAAPLDTTTPVRINGVSASHNNVAEGFDNVRNVLDASPDTRWSTVANQQPGMWFEIELNTIRMVRGLALDTAASPNDYPRGYVVRLSTDHERWTEVARNDQNDRALNVTFNPHCARYIRIEQTGTSDRWWWSIHRIGIKYG